MNSELSTKIEARINKEVSAQTGLTTTGAMAFSSVEQIMEFSKIMAIAQVAVPKHLRENPGACLAVAIQASEWQMSPFAVANKSYVVNDRIAYEAQMINAVILKRAPIRGRFRIEYSGEGDQRRCKVSATLDDGEVVEYESPPTGKIPVKNSPLWKGDPDQQLYFYSSRAMCRRHFPDVLLGVYTPEEIQESPQMRDVSPRTARAEPLNPFDQTQPQLEEQPAPAIEADLVEEDQPIDPQGEMLTDFMLSVDGCMDGADLDGHRTQCASFNNEAHRELAKKKVIARAAELGLSWNKKTGGFAKP